MLKERTSIFLISVLVITLIIVSVRFKNLIVENNSKQTNINISFKSNLSVGASAFPGNYNEAILPIASSSMLFEFTTYNKNNKGLPITLNYLCYLMKQAQYKKAIIEKSKLIYDYLLRISINPEDKQATDNLTKLTVEIGKTR